VKRQASLGVNNEWFADGIGWAGFDASDTASTKGFSWSIRLEWFRRKQVTNHHP
jgi:hypothetical protein